VSTFMEKLHFVECLTNTLAQTAGDTEQKVKDCECLQGACIVHLQPGCACCVMCAAVCSSVQAMLGEHAPYAAW
jgi:hypothetical protein